MLRLTAGIAHDDHPAQDILHRGATFCAAGIDTIMLAQAARALARKFKHELSAAPETKPGATYWAPFNLITKAALPAASAARGEGVTQHGDSDQSERSLDHDRYIHTP